MIVIVANIAAKWLFEEEFSEELDRILTGYQTMTPDFLLIEVGNIVWKKIRNGNLDPNLAEETLAKVYGLIGRLVPTIPLFPRPLTLSKTLDHPIYDCIYLALAERENAVLVTADRKLYERVKNSAYASLIAWVEEPPELLARPSTR